MIYFIYSFLTIILIIITYKNYIMSNQVVTIGYLKTFVNGVISVNTTKSDSYCPTYAELTGGTLVQNYSAGTNPTNHKPGIRIPSCTVGVGYTNNQLVIRQDLQLLWYVLQSVDVSASPTTISCCGGSSTLSTTAYFNLSTKKENGITSASTNTSTVITASYSDDKSYTTISGNKITFSKNSVNYPSSTSAAARSTTVTSTYEYSGITKTDTVSITQNSNSVGSWTWISDTTTSISVSPASMSFESGGGSKSYSVTRYYTSYYERYDSCNTLMDTDTDSNSASVTPTSYNCTGGFTCTSSKVSCDTNTGSSRTGTLTVTWGGFSDTCSLSQGASQAGTTNGEPYNYDYYLSVSTPSGKISCDGGSATFTARYVTTWDYDWETKNDAGEVTNSGTSSDSSSTNVTNSAEWSTTVGSVSKGTLTLGAYDEDTRRTATVTAKYNGYSDSDYVYQESCAPDTPTGSTVTSTTYTYRIDAADFDACDSETTVTVYATPTYHYSDGSTITGEETEISVFPLPTITYRLGTGETTVTASENSTSSSRIWTVLASFKHNNSTHTASDTATQSAGPCNTGSTASTCMNIEYSVPVALSSSVIVSFKDNSGAIIAAHTVPSTTGTTTKEICGLTNGKALTASCSDDTVTMSGGINFNFSTGTTEYITIQAPNSGPTGSTVYQYSFKNCYSDRQLGLFASNATPSGSHLQFAMLSALDGTAATVLVNSNTGTLVNGSSSNSSSSAKIGDSVKVYSVTNTTNIWTLEETITLTASNRSFEYGCSSTPTSCTCSVTSISVSPTTHTFTSNSSKSFSVTINDNDCNKCKGGFKVYNSSGTYVTSGTSSFSLSNQSGTFTIKANDNTGKTCTVTTTKYTPPADTYVFSDNTPNTNLSVGYGAYGSSMIVTSTKNSNMFNSITVSESCNWVTFESTFTSGNNYILPFNVTENTSTTERTCTVTATQGTSNKTLSWTIKQAGKPATCDCSTVSISCNPTNSYTTGNSVSTIVTVNAGSNCSTRWKAYSSSGSYLGEGESGGSLSRTTTGTVTFRSDACSGKTATWTISKPECAKPIIRLSGSGDAYVLQNYSETDEWCGTNPNVSISAIAEYIGDGGDYTHYTPTTCSFEIANCAASITSLNLDGAGWILDNYSGLNSFGISFTIRPDAIMNASCSLSGSFTYLMQGTPFSGTFSISIQFYG